MLIAIDAETNDDATTANDGGTAVYRFQNSDTSTVDTVLSSELELIGVSSGCGTWNRGFCIRSIEEAGPNTHGVEY